MLHLITGLTGHGCAFVYILSNYVKIPYALHYWLPFLKGYHKLLFFFSYFFSTQAPHRLETKKWNRTLIKLFYCVIMLFWKCFPCCVVCVCVRAQVWMCFWGRLQWRRPPARQWKLPSRERACPSRPPPASAPPTSPSPWVSRSTRPRWTDVPARYTLPPDTFLCVCQYMHTKVLFSPTKDSTTSHKKKHMEILSVQLQNLFFISTCWVSDGGRAVISVLSSSYDQTHMLLCPKELQ